MGDLAARLRALDPDSLHRAGWLLAELEREGQGAAQSGPVLVPASSSAPTWRERVWTVPGETLLGVDEVCEACGRPRSWLYRLTSTKKIPHSKLDGAVVCKAGELRAWLRERLEVVKAGEMESPQTERVLRAS